MADVLDASRRRASARDASNVFSRTAKNLKDKWKGWSKKSKVVSLLAAGVAAAVIAGAVTLSVLYSGETKTNANLESMNATITADKDAAENSSNASIQALDSTVSSAISQANSAIVAANNAYNSFGANKDADIDSLKVAMDTAQGIMSSSNSAYLSETATDAYKRENANIVISNAQAAQEAASNLISAIENFHVQTIDFSASEITQYKSELTGLSTGGTISTVSATYNQDTGEVSIMVQGADKFGEKYLRQIEATLGTGISTETMNTKYLMDTLKKSDIEATTYASNGIDLSTDGNLVGGMGITSATENNLNNIMFSFKTKYNANTDRTEVIAKMIVVTKDSNGSITSIDQEYEKTGYRKGKVSVDDIKEEYAQVLVENYDTINLAMDSDIVLE